MMIEQGRGSTSALLRIRLEPVYSTIQNDESSLGSVTRDDRELCSG